MLRLYILGITKGICKGVVNLSTPFSHLCNRANRDVMSSRYADFISSLRKEAWMRVSHFGKTF